MASISEKWLAYAREWLARTAYARTGQADPPPPETDRTHSGVFVSLWRGPRLRGCMGTLDPTLTLGDAVAKAAQMAGCEDPRFAPITPHELGDLQIELSILSPAWRMQSLAELEIGKHGIIVQQGPRRGLFLPKVAVDHKMDAQTFVHRCATEKAGIPAKLVDDPRTEVWLFEADVFREAAAP